MLCLLKQVRLRRQFHAAGRGDQAILHCAAPAMNNPARRLVLDFRSQCCVRSDGSAQYSQNVRFRPRMHTSIDQDLSDGLSKTIAIEDADKAVNGCFRIAVARQIACRRSWRGQ